MYSTIFPNNFIAYIALISCDINKRSETILISSNITVAFVIQAFILPFNEDPKLLIINSYMRINFSVSLLYLYTQFSAGSKIPHCVLLFNPGIYSLSIGHNGFLTYVLNIL